jgi:hypothetical protein
MNQRSSKWRDLVTSYQSKNWQAEFHWLLTLSGGAGVVRDPKTGEPFLHPFLPFVGPSYAPGGILVYASAQNQVWQPGEDPSAWWGWAVGGASESIWRLYSDRRAANADGPAPFRRDASELSAVRYWKIPIQPFRDGPLPALVGLALLAQHVLPPADFDSITGRVAVTNFFKFSLWRRRADLRGRERRSNLDASGLDPESRTRLIDDTTRNFIRPELAALRPGVVLCFGDQVAEAIRLSVQADDIRCRVIKVRDPSWILRGMSGTARRDGSWTRRIELAVIDGRINPEVRALVERYLEFFNGRYLNEKQPATRVYLLGHYLEFLESFRTGPAVRQLAD